VRVLGEGLEWEWVSLVSPKVNTYETFSLLYYSLGFISDELRKKYLLSVFKPPLKSYVSDHNLQIYSG